MNPADAQPFDPQRFRNVLAHYPTGVAVVTAVAEDGEPVGMVVGSFTSVSLDPPLVAFLPDKKSSTYARLATASGFCANVLAADQEELCRRFASKSAAKFEGVDWLPAPSGAPALSGAVAWIDCEFEQVVDAGDHYIVLGRVRDLGVRNPVSPLLFFQGGYGAFSTRSLVAPYERDLLWQIRLADTAREHMEALADELDLECYAQSVVGDEIVIVAGAGPQRSTVRTHIGRRQPLAPPYGALFVAELGDEAVEEWISRLGRTASADSRAACLAMVERVRQRHWSLGLLSARDGEVWTETEELPAADRIPELDRKLGRLLDGLVERYEPAELDASVLHDIRVLAAPVHGADGSVVQVLALFGMPLQVTAAQVETWRDQLIAAADAVTAAIGGRHPVLAG